jgi:methylmalonyl-CoA/ethylmalonyl-CoA epimerase
MGGIKRISHIGIAVNSIDGQISFYRDILGLPFEGREELADQKVRVAFFRAGDVRIELLEPTDGDSPVSRFLEKRGEGIHHLAYEVDDLPARIEQLRASGVKMIDETPRPGAHHTDIAFLHPKSSHGVLTEICQQRRDPVPG